MAALPGVGTDYDKLYSWCKAHAGKPVQGPTDEWSCNVGLGEVHRPVPVIVADVRGEHRGVTWGLGAVVANMKYYGETQAWMDILNGCTDVLEVVRR